MNRPSTAREALVAEAIGDAARLLDRVEVLMPALDRSRQSLDEAGTVLAGQLGDFEARIAAVTQTARTQVVQHVVRQVEEATRRAQEAQRKVMVEAARELFTTEVERTLRRLAASAPPGWQTWVTHAAAAVVASAATWTMAAWLWLR